MNVFVQVNAFIFILFIFYLPFIF